MTALTPSPNSVPLGTTTAARPPRAAGLPPGTGAPATRSLRMMYCRNSSAVSAVCMLGGKLALMPTSSSPPKGGLVRITSTRSLWPISLIRRSSVLP